MNKSLLIFPLMLTGILSTSFTVTNNVTYTISIQESRVTWIGKKITYNHTGTIQLASGELTFDDQILTGGNFVIDMTTLKDLDLEDKTKNAKLIGHLKSEDFFNVDEFPQASFEITSVTAEETENGNFMISGNLSIKGITHLNSFPAKITMSGSKVYVKAAIVFDRSKYHVRYGSGSFFDDLGDKIIYDDIEIGVELVAIKKGA